MKRTFVILLAVALMVCARQTYRLFQPEGFGGRHLSGCLSDIADEVTAIPLECPPGDSIGKPYHIRREGRELFLINRQTLYRFGCDGRFVARITDPADIRVAGYVVNPAARQLIVLGNTDDIFYYSFDGRLLDKKKLKSELPDRRLLSVAFHEGRIWSVEQKPTPAADSAGYRGAAKPERLERQVVAYDTSFRKLDAYPLVQADLGRPGYVAGCFAPRLSVAEDTGRMYAYEAAPSADYLLRDTLFLHEKRQKGETAAAGGKAIGLYPLCFGRRLWVSSYANPADPTMNYTFCYDTSTRECWQAAGGLKDNFFRTGAVEQLDAMGLNGETYSFSRSGDALRESFPRLADRGGSVVFIVTLKS